MLRPLAARLAAVVPVVIAVTILTALPAMAEVQPTASRQPARPVTTVPLLSLAAVDREAAAAEDEVRSLQGEPDRFAMPATVDITPETHGIWEELPGGREFLWRLRIGAPGSLSLNLGFAEFRLPRGGRLVLHPPRGGLAHEFTPRDHRPHGELWSPVILGEELVVELTVPRENRHDYALRLTQVGRGYRLFGEERLDKSGACNIDVVCPEGDPWRDEINSVAVFTLNGIWKCTGAMVNNTAVDGTPYFLTANHCGVNESNDQTMVVYWNFQSPGCGDQGGGSLADNQTGAIFRAASGVSDFCLVELEQLPDPSWRVTYSGWDRGDADPAEVVAIHHPSTDEKSISFEHDPTFTTSYLNNASPGDGTHLRVVDWDLGTTEPGSSGSPLYDLDHHIVGQLHGGYAACGNDLSDWYGRFSVSWNGTGAATRLRDWLDPLGAEPLALDLFDPQAPGMTVTPPGGYMAQGEAGGPFLPLGREYTIENTSDAAITYAVTTNRPWIALFGSGGTLPAGATTTAIVTISQSAENLPNGLYEGEIAFTNTTTGEGDTVRPVTLQVGSVETMHAWSLDTDPGWDRQGQWEYGQPLGGGGVDHGNADPTSGYTGTAVLGYNLAGDYPPNLPETSLTTGAIDCADLAAVSLRFRSWLNVEQPLYDHAYVRASNDGVDWVTVWENEGEITDDSWQLVECDLAAVADGEATVYLRWVMGTTDDIWQYSGWNLDDVEIRGLSAGGTPAPDTPPAVTRLLGATPNPFNPRTELRFTLARAGHARLAIHDARGRLVRLLVDEGWPAGPGAVAWDGTDGGGRHVGSGVYFARFEADGTASTAKLMLLK